MCHPLPATGRFLPLSTVSYGLVTAGEGAPSALVRSDADNWSSRMLPSNADEKRPQIKPDAFSYQIHLRAIKPPSVGDVNAMLCREHEAQFCRVER